MRRQGQFFSLVLLSWAVVECILGVQGGCPLKCSCPSLPPSCPPGISSVLDPCGCCRVCAKQFNQDCSPSEPCDHIKGLHCHLGLEGDPDRGLCRAEAEGRPCELDGRLYQHGEDFQPSCQHQCSCVDGVVGCVPLCPQRISVPVRPCTQRRLATLPVSCCHDWVCEEDEDDDNHIAEIAPLPDIRTQGQTELTGNELLAAPSPSWDSSTGFPHQEWSSSFNSQAIPPSSCFYQVTDWSPCSASCGMGVSSRVTNNNPECQLTSQTRLCQIRECGLKLTPSLKKGKKCERMTRVEEPLQISFAGCFTARQYRLRSCGSCSDGRICAPSVTRTLHLHFQCPEPDRDAFTRSFMWIQRCSCAQKNKIRTGGRGGGGLWLQEKQLGQPNDIHTYAQ
ncbi:hypothetical protein DNTS_035112 [Danionella cerebrum]|uniref:IGFBP N-terminal domain-containing protein n=1 Tax=Danionella cerebrum TaxID=2873325 RepID=A0A553PZU7_9TELE|nr:hypothetical protein DNTS_035112 [Danionella translucida]